MCASKRLTEAERKKEIMTSAANVILEKGFEKTTMDEIIAHTSLSKGGVYHYYGSIVDIFKDIMISGIEYRNNIIKEHLSNQQKITDKFMAHEIVSKMIDDNSYMPLYTEFLIAKKRNPELNSLMTELQNHTKQRLEKILSEIPNWISNSEKFQLVTDFMNAIIIASNILGARETFKQNRNILESLLINIFTQGEEEEK